MSMKLQPRSRCYIWFPEPCALQVLLVLMQESLGGNAKTSLVIAVANAEEHVDETMQSLQFGSRAMHILTRAVVNERVDVKADISPEILAQLEQKEDQANALALTLLAKENELEQIQGELQASCSLRGEYVSAVAKGVSGERSCPKLASQGERA